MSIIAFLHKANLFLRSLIFSLLMMFSLCIQCVICICAWPFPLRFRYKLITNYTQFIIWLLKITCRINYKVTGIENIPQNRNGIILSKHQSTWETFFLPAYFHQAAIILKRELLWVPFFGWGLATVDPIAINRSDAGSAMDQIIRKGKRALAAGRWILVFPEGTRIPAGKVGKYRLGGARLAVSTGSPVIPIAHNAGYFWAKRRFIKKPGTIQVVIGPLIETQGKQPEEIMAQVKEWIEGTIRQLGQH